VISLDDSPLPAQPFKLAGGGTDLWGFLDSRPGAHQERPEFRDNNTAATGAGNVGRLPHGVSAMVGGGLVWAEGHEAYGGSIKHSEARSLPSSQQADSWALNEQVENLPASQFQASQVGPLFDRFCNNTEESEKWLRN
jgi:hypothetical protein